MKPTWDFNFIQVVWSQIFLFSMLFSYFFYFIFNLFVFYVSILFYLPTNLFSGPTGISSLHVFWNLISPLFLKFDIKKLMLCYVFLCSDFSVLMFCFFFSFLMLLLLCGCVAWKNVYNCWRRGSVLVLLVDLLPQNCRW